MKVLALRDRTSGLYHSRSGYFHFTDNFSNIGFYTSMENLGRHLARVAKSINREIPDSDWTDSTIRAMKNAEIVEFELIPKTIDPLESQGFINQKCLAKVKQ